MSNTSKKVAVFDMDGTIFRSSLIYELMEEMIAQRLVPLNAKARYIDSWRQWQMRSGTQESGFGYYQFIMDVVEAYMKYIVGLRRSSVWKIAEKIITTQKHRTYRFTRELVEKLKDKYYLLAISHSPFEVVSPFAKELGFDKVYAQIYEVDEKVRFTGTVLYQDIILHKDLTLQRAIEHNNLSLNGSIGVGDTESDIPFLKLVDRAIAFNPSMKLYKEAVKQKWEIVVERKDVIYRL